MTQITVIGDSHLAALKLGFDLEPAMAGAHDIGFHPLGWGGSAVTRFFEVDPETGAVRTQAKGWNNIQIDQETVGQGGLWVLSLPLNTSRVVRNPVWQRYCPWPFKPASEDHLTLSEAATAALLKADFGNAVAYATALAELGLDIAVIEAPRFFDHAPQVRQCQPGLIAEIDARYRRLVRAALADAGIPVIAQPAQTVAPNGATRQQYRTENPADSHHASTEYGHLAMRAIVDFAERARTDLEDASGQI